MVTARTIATAYGSQCSLRHQSIATFSTKLFDTSLVYRTTPLAATAATRTCSKIKFQPITNAIPKRLITTQYADYS